ncbi:MAG: tRNA pseudouridine(55) synthase TruB [Candidatus Neomarinimicrobiota bacterium]
MTVDKPRGWTSFDVVKKIRAISGERKVGHAGTLDPFAQGVLVLGIGRKGTKQLGRLALLEKEYEARLRLGIGTDTLDCDGKVISRMPLPQLCEKDIKEVFRSFTRTVMQTPPMFSAKKVAGTRLYKLARQNIEVDRAPVAIEIKSLTLNSFSEDTIDFSVTCSKGTYVRQLGADLALALGTVGHLVALKRMRVGHFTLEESKGLEELSKKWLSTAE